MFRIFATICVFIAALAIAPPAAAQTVSSKVLCEGSPSGNCQTIATTKIAMPVYYQFEVSNGGNANVIAFTEDLPASFVPASTSSPIICTTNAGNNAPVVITSPGIPLGFNVSLGANENATCRMAGHFNTPGISVINTVSMAGSSDGENTFISPTTKLPVDLEIEKSIIVPSSKYISIAGGPQRVKYRIEIETDEAVYLGSYFSIYDQLALYSNGIPIDAALVTGSVQCFVSPGASSGSICNVTNQNSGTIQSTNWQNFASWGFAPGTSLLLSPGERLTIEYEIEYSVPVDASCIKKADSDGIKNRAFLGLAGTGVALDDDSDGNNDTVGDNDANVDVQTGIYNVDPLCGAVGAGPPSPPSPLEITKDFLTPMSSSPKPWGFTVTYVIKVENTAANIPPAFPGSTRALDIKLKDIIQNMMATPNFKVQLLEVQTTCPAGSTCTQTAPNTQPGPIQAITSYYDRKQMWEAHIDELRPGQTAKFYLKMRFTSPTCDYSPDVSLKPIRNYLESSHRISRTKRKQRPFQSPIIVWVDNDYSHTDYEDISMEQPPACAVTVKKTALGTQTSGQFIPPDKIVFDEWMKYEVVYEALPSANAPLRIGTLIDAMRIANPFYAYGLNVQYDWKCDDMKIGSARVRDYKSSDSGNATVNYVGAPHQGARIMDHPGFVEFDPGAKLKCKIKIKVKKPDPSDPYCFSDGDPRLENLALLDGSLYLNSNGPWPMAPQGKTWDAVSSSLPKCYNLIVNKNASPGVVAPGGGPVTYTITITNGNLPGTSGDINFPVGSPSQGTGPFFVDKFTDTPSGSALPNSPNVLSAGNPCLPVNQHPCDSLITNGGKTLIGITQIAASQSITYDYKVAGPYTPHQLCNDIAGEMVKNGSTYHRDWYPKNISTWESGTCTQVRSSLAIDKQFIIPPGIAMAGSTQFTIDIECNSPSPFSDVKQSLAVSPANPSSKMGGIYVGSNCEIDEVDLPDADQWGDCDWLDPVYPDGKTILMNGSVEPHRLRVINQLVCAEQPSTLSIEKTLVSAWDCPSINAICTFRITVTNNGPGYFSGPVNIVDEYSDGGNPVGHWLIPPANAFTWDWTCSQATPGSAPIICDETALTLAPNESSYFEITLDTPYAGTNCATLNTPLQQPKPQSCVDTGVVVTTIPDPKDLTIVKTKTSPGDCHTTIIPNGLPQPTYCAFQFVVTNNATTDYPGPVVIHDNVIFGGAVFPVIVVSHTPGWSCTTSNPSVECTFNGPIPAGSSITLDLVLHLYSIPAPAEKNCATLGNVDLYGRLIKSCVGIGAIPNLSIEKRKITPGNCHSTVVQNVCEFEIVITNNGNSSYIGPITISDAIIPGNLNGGVLSLDSYSGGWDCQVTGNITTCSTNANVTIPPNGTITLLLTLKLNYGAPTEKNCAAITNPLPSNNAPPISSCVDIASSNGPQLTIDKQLLSDPDCANTGNRHCTFRITVGNAGSSIYTGQINISDVVDFGGTPQPTPIVSQSGGVWNCQPGSGNVGMDCIHLGPVFTSINGTSYFDITLDLSAFPPVHIGNCAKIMQPAFNPRPRSCVQLGPLWEPPSERNSISEKRRKKVIKKWLKGKKKKKKFKLPKIRVRIGVGGVIGGKKKDRKPKPEKPLKECDGKVDANGNPVC